MKKLVTVLVSCLSCSVFAASNEISLDLGVDFIGGYPNSNDTGSGFNGQLGYQYNLDDFVSFYTGVGSGDDGFSSVTANIIGGVTAGALTGSTLPAEEFEYTMIPFAVQLNYPIDNNVFFIRGGGNAYWIKRSNVYNPADQSLSSNNSNGVGAYGAAGWRYYFGDASEWGIGLTYQYIGLKDSFYSQVGSFTVSYGF